MNVRLCQGKFFEERIEACCSYLKILGEGTITDRNLCSGEHGRASQTRLQHFRSDPGVHQSG